MGFDGPQRVTANEIGIEERGGVHLPTLTFEGLELVDQTVHGGHQRAVVVRIRNGQERVDGALHLGHLLIEARDLLTGVSGEVEHCLQGLT